jgi:hypothetical protein
MRFFYIQHLFSIFALYYFAWLLFLLCNVGKILFRTQTEQKPLHQLMFTNKERGEGWSVGRLSLSFQSVFFLSFLSLRVFLQSSMFFSMYFYVYVSTLFLFVCFSHNFLVSMSFGFLKTVCCFVFLYHFLFRNLFFVAVVFIVMSFP